ncbi:ammonium transporter [Alphaproteobacteria bacterium]|jgi:Amt family ammonium transporter|nr:ammonium transporter [Alphaproteobacteria bacterium]|tara:strand:- start:1627 stop:2925 length:1299 start_codon:yes stop_codon:yes gene_type:complete
MLNFSKLFVLTTILLTIFSSRVLAAPDPETAYIFNSFSFLVHGFLVMLMAAGFCMLETGLVRAKNAVVQCAKNIGLYSIAGLMFAFVGYNLMYMDVTGWIGSFALWAPADELKTFGGDKDSTYSSGSDWFFQMVFCATAASIVSGAVAERIKLKSFFIFVVVLCGFIYPIQGSWSWGGGFLSEAGFLDFAGSSIVHGVGGWAALTGAIILGARKGKYAEDGSITPMPGSNLPLATLGTFLLWFGWFGFNGGSQLAMGTAADVAAISNIYINTNLAAAGGVVVAIILTMLFYKKTDLTMALNGALGGLVAITAEPLAPTPMLAIFIGAVGGLIVVLAIPMLDKLKIDDVVGAIPVHLFAGIWGTIAVVFSNSDATIGAQLYGILSIGAFTIIASTIVWYLIKLIMGIRVTPEEEMEGTDISEIGMEAYPDFKK